MHSEPPAWRTFRVGFLTDHISAIAEIATWVWESWGYPSRSACERDLQQGRRASLPISYVALQDELPMGVVNLIECNLPTRCHLSPWLAGLYVETSYREVGVGTTLVSFLEAHAAAIGFTDLYLYTQNAEGFYKRLGWKTIERTLWEGEAVAVMSKSLTDGLGSNRPLQR